MPRSGDFLPENPPQIIARNGDGLKTTAHSRTRKNSEPRQRELRIRAERDGRNSTKHRESDEEKERWTKRNEESYFRRLFRIPIAQHKSGRFVFNPRQSEFINMPNDRSRKIKGVYFFLSLIGSHRPKDLKRLSRRLFSRKLYQ